MSYSVPDTCVFALTLPKAVLFRHRDAPAVLDLPWQGEGSSKRAFVRLTFELPSERALRCDIRPVGLFGFLSFFVGGEDIRLGWEVFDDHFVVKTNAPAEAAIIFAPRVQEQLLELQEFADLHAPRQGIGPGYFDVSLSGNRLQLRMQGVLQNAQQLMMFYQACSRIYDLITAGQPTPGSQVES